MSEIDPGGVEEEVGAANYTLLSVSVGEWEIKKRTNKSATHDSGWHNDDPFPGSDVVKTVDLGYY